MSRTCRNIVVVSLILLLTIAIVVPSVLFGVRVRAVDEPLRISLSSNVITHAAPIERGYLGYDIGEELTSNRTINSKSYVVDEWGSYTVTSHENLHYGVDLLDIDTAIETGVAPWDWQMVEADYQAYFLDLFTDGQVGKFTKNNHSVLFQPMALEWADGSQTQQISMPVEIYADIDGNRISWSDAYGAGIDFTWETSNVRLDKLLTVTDNTSWPLAEPYILDGNPTLQWNLIFDPDSDLDIIFDGGTWDKKSDVYTYEAIEFEISGEVQWSFNAAEYWDSDGDSGQALTKLDKRGNSLYITISIPYDWIQTAEYPIYIDPPVDGQPVKYEPSITYDRWQGESLITLDTSSLGIKKAYQTGNITYGESRDINTKLYPITNGIEYEIIYNNLPSSNVLSLPIDVTNLNYYYQPPLNEEIQIGEEDVASVNATHALSANGTVLHYRPPEVVGSYAVYHATREGLNANTVGDKYKTGKAWHIYRPLIIDDAGNKTWGTLDITGGNLTITIDNAWLQTAEYPVVVDPTFGILGIGGASGTINDYARGIAASPADGDGTTDDIQTYINFFGNNEYAKAAIYEADNDLLDVSDEVAGAQAGGWVTFPNVTTAVSNGVDYEFTTCGDSNMNMYYDSTGQDLFESIDYADYPSDPGGYAGPPSANRKYSIYVNYTASGGGSANITNSPSTYDFGQLNTSSTANTGLTHFTVVNSSGAAIDIAIYSTNMTDQLGGTQWTLSDTASPGSDTVGLTAGLSGGSYNVTIKQASAADNLIEDLADTANVSWGVKIFAPTAYSDGNEKSGNITIAASLS